jgi:hypothetical protein
MVTYEADIPSPGLDDLLDLTAAQLCERIAGPVPARVTAYDMATQRASVQPLVMVPRNGVLQKLPTYQQVPVLWPSGVGWAIHGPMAPGDLVWLMVAGGDIGHWQASGAENSPAATLRTHDYSDVVALPGGRPLSAPLSSEALDAYCLVLSCGHVKIGDSTASKPVVLNGDTVAISGALATWMSNVQAALLGGGVGVPLVGVTVPPLVGTVVGTTQSTAYKAFAI